MAPDPLPSADQAESDNDQYRMYCNPVRPTKVSQREIENKATWESWCEQNLQRLANQAPSQSAGIEGLDASGDSTLDFLAAKKVIHSAREYQLELFERAKSRNTIVVLETGSGKTLIAALLLRHTLEQELERRALNMPKKIAFFLVDKVPLVDQQYDFLCCNIGYPIIKFCGHNARWSKLHWDLVIDEHMVVVCTAAILQKCLASAFIRMRQINLLIFDEAHHAKKNHVYARIIKDFYLPELKPEHRPRILGMTASPVDAKEDIWPAAMRLEQGLNSEIITASPEALFRSGVERQSQEEQCLYETLHKPFITPLTSKLERIMGRLCDFKRLTEFARTSSSELGPWCTDRFWHGCVTTRDIQIFSARFDRDRARLVKSPLEDRSHINVANATMKVLRDNPLPRLERSSNHLSSKVLSLITILERTFQETQVTRCIVFVEMRYTARLLHDLFNEEAVRIPGLKPGLLLGGYSGELTSVRMTRVAQTAAICRFRRGDFNCLFSTSVAEEGIDIPGCDIVIRFDLYTSMIQYVQSKGRARHQKSRYINMLEIGNRDHYRRVMQARVDAQSLQRFCSKLPAERTVDELDLDYKGDLIDSEYQQLIIKETGAKLTFTHSIDVLAAFVASLDHPMEQSLRPEYIVMSHGRFFICEVLLPEISPMRSKTGKPQSRRREAKCSAAFELCSELVKRKYLDGHLQPIFTKKARAMQNARLAVSSAKKTEYEMKVKPDAWLKLGTPEKLYATALVLTSPGAMGRPSRPLIFLSRHQMPDIPKFSLYFNENQASDVQLISMSMGNPIDLSSEQLEGLRAFTLRIFSDVFSKWYEADVAQWPYLLAPSNVSHQDIADHRDNPVAPICWEDVGKAVPSDGPEEAVDYSSMPDEFFSGRFLTDPNDGSRKFFTAGIAKGLRPQDRAPDWVSWPWARQRQGDCDHSILAFSYSRIHRQGQKQPDWNQDQPVVEAELASLKRNLSVKPVGEPKQLSQCFVVLEPLRISPLSAEVAAMALTFPSAIHRLESYMITLEGCELLGLTIDLDLALEALTKDKDIEEASEESARDYDARVGMSYNYERLEFLGDAFLKMATTISLFTRLPEAVENDYHVERMLLICNRNLFNGAVDKKLQEFIRLREFDRRSWYPAGLKLVRGKAQKIKYFHKLSDKTIADVCEAIIGAAYVSHAVGATGLDMAVKAVTTMVKGKHHRQTAFADYYTQYVMPAWQMAPFSAVHVDLAEQLRVAAGYRFRSPALARSAFKHPSYPYDSVPHYQRLEFLGDALLDMICTDYLYRSFVNAGPQWLTEHRMSMVSNRFLGCLAVELGFHRHVLNSSHGLISQISEYVQALEFAREETRQALVRRAECAKPSDEQMEEPGQPKRGPTPEQGQGQGQGQEHKEGQHVEEEEQDLSVAEKTYWVRTVEPPKALADVVEAYLGAMFVDSQYDFATVHDFFHRHIQPFFVDIAPYDYLTRHHPVTKLAHLLSTHFGCTSWSLRLSGLPELQAVLGGAPGRIVCGILIHGRVCGDAIGASGRVAKADAARAVLIQLQPLSPTEFRRQMACNCFDH